MKDSVDGIIKACKGAGTDEKALVDITKKANYAVREAICTQYAQQTGNALVDTLRKELSGNMEKLMMAMYTPRYQFWAQEINEAIKGAGTDEKKLIDLVIACNDQEMDLLDKAYTAQYKKSLHSAVSGDAGSTDWGKLLKAWIKNDNQCNGSPDQLADMLSKAAKGAGTDEAVFINVMTNCNHQTYAAVDQTYQKKFGKSLRSVIEKEFTGKSEYAFLAAHDFLLNPVSFVANMLKRSMKGAGTNDD